MIAFFMEKFCITGFFFSTLAFNVHCGQQSSSQKVAVNDTVKITGCQEKLQVKTGAIVEIKLESVPGNGYQWLPKTASELLVLQDKDNLKFTKPSSTEPVIGQPGYQILHFKAMKRGQETMKLEYKRVFETEINKTCEIRIEID